MQMNKDSLVNINSELLKKLEIINGITDLPSQQSFPDILQLDKAIIYLLVEWSGPERMSRYNIYKALNELGNKCKIPVFKTDCSDQRKQFVIDWLIGQPKNQEELYYGGWGGTLLIEKGIIIDLIKNPGKLKPAMIKNKLQEWNNLSANL